jgi:Flp pilus assembly protein TadD
MSKPLRFSSAASLVVLGSIVAGCAAPQGHVTAASHFGGKADQDIGLATRALAALNSNNVPMAIDLAERAVAKTPNDAGYRALLGNAYFAGGRFHSAEQAYRDALTLYPGQPQVVLKLALVQIAQGKNDVAVRSLNEGRELLDASDYGLALALAGHSVQAMAVLEPAARSKDADATVRQNLALAHALAGDWNEARIIAGQDVPANQLDARMQQWMKLANPGRPSDQVAALVGVTPAAVDAGQPVQLALNKGETQVAEAVAAPAPATVPAKPAVVAAAAPMPAPAPAVVAVAPAPPPPRQSAIASLATSAVTEAKAVLAAVLPHSIAPAATPVKAAAPRRAVAVAQPINRGKSPAVVQLGAYASPARVLTAWDGAARKYAVLRAYLPMSARFSSPKGTFYRLSVRGFASDRDARLTCESLRRKGASCFVRNVAGDAPMQIASR